MSIGGFGVKGLGRRLAKPQRQAGALTADVLAVIRLTAVQPRRRGRSFETSKQAAERSRFDLALVAVLSDGGLRRSEASSLTWGDVQRWDDGSGRITVVRSKTDALAQGAVVAVTPAAMKALDAIRPVGVAGNEKVFGLSESQIARRVKAIAKSSRSGGLGVLQWPQRARGHGPSHGSERRAHPRDRTPGPLETGRRHGRPLHPRRIRRIRAAVPINISNQRGRRETASRAPRTIAHRRCPRRSSRIIALKTNLKTTSGGHWRPSGTGESHRMQFPIRAFSECQMGIGQ